MQRQGAAAADLCAALEEPLTIAPMQRVLVPTGLAIELPDAGCVALVYARSGLSIKHGLCMANGVGVVDSDYRGELKVPMINLWHRALHHRPRRARSPTVHCSRVAGRLCTRRHLERNRTR